MCGKKSEKKNKLMNSRSLFTRCRNFLLVIVLGVGVRRSHAKINGESNRENCVGKKEFNSSTPAAPRAISHEIFTSRAPANRERIVIEKDIVNKASFLEAFWIFVPPSRRQPPQILRLRNRWWKRRILLMKHKFLYFSLSSHLFFYLEKQFSSSSSSR